jgi:exopolysaccharide biosynthesis WecB/TagA/CpsF family protein
MKFSFGQTEIRVNIPDRAALLEVVRTRLSAGQGFALATINLDHIVKLERDPTFRPVYAAQDLVVADGNPVVWLSRLARHPVSLVPGSDLVVPLVQVAADSGRPIALVGATSAALKRAADHLMAIVPRARIIYCQSPPMGFDPEGDLATRILEELANQSIGLCLIALGAPKQERFAAMGRKLAPGTGFASVGAGLDFLAGTQKRAPRWARRMALEWLWRALSDPQRLFPRYAACIAVLPGRVAEALRQRN